MLKKVFITVTAAMIAFVACSQSISTGNPDVRGKVKSCVAEGKEVFVEFVLVNVSDDEARVNVATDLKSAAYDDEGNVYEGDNLSILDGNYYLPRRGVTLVPQVAVKFRLKITGVPTSVSEIPYIKLDAYGGIVENYIFKGLDIERY